MKKIVFCLVATFLFSSCAVLDYPKRFLGYSVAHFEKETYGRFEISSVAMPADKAYNKCNLFIFENNLRTNFKSDKKLYVVASQFSLIYDACLDSTDVGFFVYELDDKTSKIEIISNNSLLAKFVYDKLKEYIVK